MIRLSRAGWNNVIIYSVMAFILLINLTQKNSQDESAPAAEVSQLIADHQVILTLTINQWVSVERIGQTWRTLPNVLTGQPLDQMMMSWHNLEVQMVDKPADFDQSNAVIVSALLAGDSDLHYFMLKQTANGLLIFKQAPSGEELWYVTQSQRYQQLLPPQVIAPQGVNKCLNYLK
ncbi:hypothetical protein LP316_03970 [Thalassotalea sp. LPB0316]|uniref:hypothetical protein n=1 Tax=Thalassotalea sp. LPB0316 TaxID=2769490 RepID=UPI001865A60D|nr:hypothetical protein [Thalassotalea sp. LPB0316]QOL26466.1 hypothetical protein LP316_03970 [Thalassotalea sp. LPB0316]